MKYIITLVLAFIISGTSFGKANLYIDDVDAMTDERNLSMAFEDISTTKTRMGEHLLLLACYGGKPAFIVSSGLIFHMDEYIKVMLRFDKNAAITERMKWISDNNVAVIIDNPKYLEKAIESDQLLVKVDDKSIMKFDLKSGREDLQKFAEQCTPENF
jgi:hypothetical protein